MIRTCKAVRAADELGARGDTEAVPKYHAWLGTGDYAGEPVPVNTMHRALALTGVAVSEPVLRRHRARSCACWRTT